jgi:hypothetical protein
VLIPFDLSATDCVKTPLTQWIVWINRVDFSSLADARKGIYFTVKRVWTPASYK